MFDRPSATIYRFPVADKSSSIIIAPTATEEGGSVVVSTAVVEVKESMRGFLQVGRRNLKEEEISTPAVWPAPGSADTELGVLMEAEVCHGETEVYTRVQA
jgi:hypothetical protein